MGDNAHRDKEWHNTIVGQGYQARGVIRQPGLQPIATKIIDMSGKSVKVATKEESIDLKETSSDHDSSKSSKHKKRKHKDDKKEKSKKSSKHKKHKHEKKDRHDKSDRQLDDTDEHAAEDRFNPLIQLFLSKFPN